MCVHVLHTVFELTHRPPNVPQPYENQAMHGLRFRTKRRMRSSFAARSAVFSNFAIKLGILRLQAKPFYGLNPRRRNKSV